MLPLFRLRPSSPVAGVRRAGAWRRLWGALALVLVAVGPAQESELVEMFVQKGLVSEHDIAEARADMLRARQAESTGVVLRGKSTQRLSIGMLLMTQYTGLRTTRDFGAPAPDNRHFMVRRAVLGLRASLGEDWDAIFAYNFAGPNFATAVLQWSAQPELTVDLGLRKVSLGYEEYSSPTQVRTIETSPASRYFTEGNNGRRLGAASYRLGVFVSGEQGGFRYGAAITNPERIEEVDTLATAGNATNNQPAFWANVGYAGKVRGASFVTGLSAGYLPEQGGAGNTRRGQGHDLAVGNAFLEVLGKRWGLQGEAFAGHVDEGAVNGGDASPWSYYLQASYLAFPTVEGVVRYSAVDSDGRGVDLSDAVRSAPSSGLLQSATEWYFGGNWYLKQNDLKFSLGFLYAQGRALATSPPAAEARAYGVRSQMQVNF